MTRKFTLEIEIENDAFHPDAHLEVGHRLAELGERINQDGFIMAGVENDMGASAGIWDANGNWCGHWTVILDERLDHDPIRWQKLTEREMQALQTAINSRMRELHMHGRKCDLAEDTESKALAQLSREMNLELERRNS